MTHLRIRRRFQHKENAPREAGMMTFKQFAEAEKLAREWKLK